FANRDTAAFYDCMAFRDGTHGFAFSDAVNARMPLVRTSNGRDWVVTQIAAQAGEGGFAASGGCAQASADGHAWIVTGAAATPRVLHSRDGGSSWAATNLPLVSGAGAGATAVVFRDSLHGVVVGGAIGGSATGARVATTQDGGLTWTVGGEPPITGALYGLSGGMVAGQWTLIAVGPGGAVVSRDQGATWTLLDGSAYWSVGFNDRGSVWLVGPRGRVVRVDWR
ncbi:MAG TPA: hypothetical protein VE861_09325, partial [Gemmatimonadaceae bacterium]|nr:hypothetical protein [Gemmatimonadaceae bacterium]